MSPELSGADELLDYLLNKVEEFEKTGNPLRDRYVGFYVLTTATHVETVVKEKIIEFCESQNIFLHAIIKKELDKFNGRIAYQDLRALLSRFDKCKESRFHLVVGRLCRQLTIGGATDLVKAYQNVLVNRHRFVHNLHATFADVSVGDLRSGRIAAKYLASAFCRAVDHQPLLLQPMSLGDGQAI